MSEDERKDNAQEEKSFAQLLEETSVEYSGALKPGQMVEAKIVRITLEWAFLDVGERAKVTWTAAK